MWEGREREVKGGWGGVVRGSGSRTRG